MEERCCCFSAPDSRWSEIISDDCSAKDLENHVVGFEQRKANLFDREASARRAPYCVTPCIIGYSDIMVLSYGKGGAAKFVAMGLPMTFSAHGASGVALRCLKA